MTVLQEDTIEITEVDGEEARDAFAAAVLTILDNAARDLGRPFDQVPLHVKATDTDGNLVGGLVGSEVQGWLFVKFLAVDAARRSGGVGGRLLARAEDVGRQRGLVGIYLDTFDFQAPAFYFKQGFSEIGRLPSIGGWPERIWFAKPFGDASFP